MAVRMSGAVVLLIFIVLTQLERVPEGT